MRGCIPRVDPTLGLFSAALGNHSAVQGETCMGNKCRRWRAGPRMLAGVATIRLHSGVSDRAVCRLPASPYTRQGGTNHRAHTPNTKGSLMTNLKLSLCHGGPLVQVLCVWWNAKVCPCPCVSSPAVAKPTGSLLATSSARPGDGATWVRGSRLWSGGAQGSIGRPRSPR